MEIVLGEVETSLCLPAFCRLLAGAETRTWSLLMTAKRTLTLKFKRTHDFYSMGANTFFAQTVRIKLVLHQAAQLSICFL